MFSFNTKSYFEDNVSKVFEVYEERLVSMNCLDFDDILLKTYEILEQKEEIKKQQNKYIKNNFSQTKNTKKKISPETFGPLLTKINAEFPGSTYIEEE